MECQTYRDKAKREVENGHDREDDDITILLRAVGAFTHGCAVEKLFGLAHASIGKASR